MWFQIGTEERNPRTAMDHPACGPSFRSVDPWQANCKNHNCITPWEKFHFCICQCQRFWKVLFDIKCFYLWLLKWFSFFCIPCVYHWVPFVSILFGSVQNKLEWKEFLFRKLRNLWTRHWTECSIDQRSGGRRRPKELKNKSQNIRIRVKHSCEHHQTCHNTSFNSRTGHFPDQKTAQIQTAMSIWLVYY